MLSLRSLISLACLFWLIQQFPAIADPGLPSALSESSSNQDESSKSGITKHVSSLNGEYKDSGLGATDAGSSSLNHLKIGDTTLTGKANLNVKEGSKMPPLAPPIHRSGQGGGSFVIHQGLDQNFVPAPAQDGYRSPPLNGRVNGFGGQRPMPPFRGQGQFHRFQPPANSPLAGQVQDSRFGRPQKRPFFLGAKKDTSMNERPSWLPAHAYSNANMIAPYHNSSLMWWDKSAMPNKPQWVVLSTSVTKYWRGRAPNPCWIMVSPNPLAPGNFTFRSRARFGPRGWLQALGKKSKFGFPLYRYWLDQP